MTGLGADFLTLGRIDEPRNLLLQSMYLSIGALVLVFSTAQKSEWVHTGMHALRLVARVLVRYGGFVFHFAMGALLSAFTFFYFKSASGAGPTIFLLGLATALILNELPWFQKLGVSIRSVFFQLALVSFATFVIPMMVGRLHGGLFVLAVFLSASATLLMALCMHLLGVALESIRRQFLKPCASVLTGFCVLYLFDFIPPIPLSVQYVGAFHSVERVGSTYHLATDEEPWYQAHLLDPVIHLRPRERVYIFVRIFAPRDFSEKVFLRWEWDNPESGWVETDRIRLPIRGGRGRGFRGYTYKANHQPGLWQVFIESSDGRGIGHYRFEIRPEPSNKGATRTYPLVQSRQ